MGMAVAFRKQEVHAQSLLCPRSLIPHVPLEVPQLLPTP